MSFGDGDNPTRPPSTTAAQHGPDAGQPVDGALFFNR